MFEVKHQNRHISQSLLALPWILADQVLQHLLSLVLQVNQLVVILSDFF